MTKFLLKAKPMLLTLAVSLCVLLLLCPVSVYADTDGTELQVTDQPDTLTIQLGQEWAGVEFELKTDAGLYPQPVVVSDAGVLTMELGGSKTYLLSVINSPVATPDSGSTESQAPQEPGEEGGQHSQLNQGEDGISANEPPADQDTNLIRGIPNMHLFLFGGGLVVSIAALVAMWIFKRRRNRYDTEDEDDYDE